MIPLENEELISLLPYNTPPETLLMSDKLPCHGAKIKSQPTKYILNMLGRQAWSESLYVRKNDLNKLYKYKNPNGNYKNDFDENQFLVWVKCLEENTAICDMENNLLGKGVFVPPGKKLPKGTFIISSGIIKLNPTKEELETKVHCSAFQDLNSPDKKIIGLIDPNETGGILDLINHAPDEEEIVNFVFNKRSIKMNVATSNLRSKIKFYKGYSIMGLEVVLDIEGDEKGKQLLWSYASPDEYLSHDFFKSVYQALLLFDNRNEHNGETIDVINYNLKEINIFIDMGKLMLQKIATLTRWELMERSPNSNLIISTQDSWLSIRLVAIQASITYGFLQSYLKKNIKADRVIIKIPSFNEPC